jgi:hypothetical protein
LSVQVDIDYWINSLRAGIDVVPTVLIAIVLLGGPTAAWLLYRFVVQPRSMRARAAAVVGGAAMWVCPTCRSVNDLAQTRCYRCVATPNEDELEVIDASPAGPIHLTAVGRGLNLGRRDVGTGAPIARIERAATVWIEDEMWAELEARRDRAAIPDVAAMTELVEAPHGRRVPRPPAVIPIAPARRAAAAAGGRPDVSRPRRVVAAGPGQDPDDSPAA